MAARQPAPDASAHVPIKASSAVRPGQAAHPRMHTPPSSSRPPVAQCLSPKVRHVDAATHSNPSTAQGVTLGAGVTVSAGVMVVDREAPEEETTGRRTVAPAHCAQLDTHRLLALQYTMPNESHCVTPAAAHDTPTSVLLPPGVSMLRVPTAKCIPWHPPHAPTAAVMLSTETEEADERLAPLTADLQRPSTGQYAALAAQHVPTALAVDVHASTVGWGWGLPQPTHASPRRRSAFVVATVLIFAPAAANAHAGRG